MSRQFVWGVIEINVSRRGKGIAVVLVGWLLGMWGPGAAVAQEAQFIGRWVPIYHEDGPERIPGPDVGDYLGLPVNDAARLRADSFNANILSAVPEFQCRQEPPDYGFRGNAILRVEADVNPLSQRTVALRTHMNFMSAERVIYLDRRPHPPDKAVHTWSGFSTANWNGATLTITTTHLKRSVARRNGVPTSDSRTVNEYWMRRGNFLTIVTATTDPVFYTEPLVRSQTFALDQNIQITDYPCTTAAENPPPPGTVPHHLPGTNPDLREVSATYGLPFEATRGGAETMYPEYRKSFSQSWSTLGECRLYCTCMNVGAICPLLSPP